MTETKKENAETEAKLIEVPTQTAIAYQLDDKTIVDEKGMLIRIYNKLCNIEKAVA